LRSTPSASCYSKLNSYKSKSKIRAGYDALSLSVSFCLHRLFLSSANRSYEARRFWFRSFSSIPTLHHEYYLLQDWAGPDSLNTLFSSSVEH
jgi:hypothetical protein